MSLPMILSSEHFRLEYRIPPPSLLLSLPHQTDERQFGQGCQTTPAVGLLWDAESGSSARPHLEFVALCALSDAASKYESYWH